MKKVMKEQDYGRRLYIKRKEMGFTQENMAKLLGISRSYYASIESGQSIPGGSLIFKINKIIPIFFLR